MMEAESCEYKRKDVVNAQHYCILSLSVYGLSFTTHLHISIS